MQRWRTKLLLTAGVAAALAAIPAFGQADQPESQLPPGFGDPGTPAPAPPPPPPAPDTAAAPEAPPPPPSALADVGTVIENSADADLAALGEDLTPVKPIEIPESARRPVDVVGIIGPADWGVGVDGFGKADGRFRFTCADGGPGSMTNAEKLTVLVEEVGEVAREVLSPVPQPGLPHPDSHARLPPAAPAS